MDLLKTQTGRVLVESHRGVEREGIPENSWTGIKAAYEEGADFIEVDVQLSRDGVPFLHHNYTLADGRWCHDLDWNELKEYEIEGERLPLLSEVLEWAQESEAKISLDLKPGFKQVGRLSMKTAQLIRDRNCWEHIMLLAWDHRELKQIKEAFPKATTRFTLFARPANLSDVAKAADCDAVGLSYGVARPEDVEELHAQNIAVSLGGMWQFDLDAVQNLDVDILGWGRPSEARQALGYT